MTPAIWLYCASALSLFTMLLHVFGGGRSAASPLLASDLNDEAKFTNYYCWHMVTITIGCMAVGFALAASGTASADLAIAATLLAALFTVWSVALTLWKKQRLMTLPQWILFLPIAMAGAMGSF